MKQFLFLKGMAAFTSGEETKTVLQQVKEFDVLSRNGEKEANWDSFGYDPTDLEELWYAVFIKGGCPGSALASVLDPKTGQYAFGFNVEIEKAKQEAAAGKYQITRHSQASMKVCIVL